MSNLQTKVYLLHGWAIDSANAQKWQPLQNLLRKQGIDSQFLSIPGLSKAHDQVWDLNDYVAWLINELPQRQPIILLGHSFGGQLAIRFTAQNPHLVDKLILVDSAGIRNNKLLPWLKRNVFFCLAKIGKLVFKAAIFRKLLYKIAREQDYYTAPENMRETMIKVINDSVKPDLTKITCPILIIWGKQDKVTPLWIGQEFANKIKRSQLEIVEQARHSPQFTHSKKTSDLISQFLKIK